MAELSSFTHKFRANIDSQHSSGPSKVSKRNRQPLSCAPCRLKKLKCDRGHPCDGCLKRGDVSSCSYGKIPLSKPTDVGPNGTSNGTSNRGRAQEKLKHLEQLVMQMVDNGTGSQASDQSGSNQKTNGNGNAVANAHEGHLQYSTDESRYVGSTHWSAILDNIQELKSELGTGSTSHTGGHQSSIEPDDSEDLEPHTMDALFGPSSHLTLESILAQALPPRLQVDRRLSAYFNSSYTVIPLVHTQQFKRQYEQFWRSPLETPPVWISMLFSICCVSAGLSEASGSELATPTEKINHRTSFLNAACQCLRLDGFVQPKRYVVEALALYCQCKYMTKLDPSQDLAIIFAILVRLAYRSGYHREPSQFPHFSVFEGEMRRRTWAMCRQMDLMGSFQLGLPAQIPPNSWDTQNPRNLLDADFNEDIAILPPSRPETEPTTILYFVVKTRLMTTFGKVCANALSFDGPKCTPEAVMAMDREVRATYATVPEILHAKPMSQSFADPSYLIMSRTNCEFLYRKTLLVLHRRYMTQDGFEQSTKACTEAAIAITKYMLDLHKEFKPGGQLYLDRWMLSSFTMNDFYLAAMVLCLALSTWKKANQSKNVSDDAEMSEQYNMLRQSFVICEELGPTSNEAKRVTNVLRAVLGVKDAGSNLTPDSGVDVSPSDSNPFRTPGRYMPSAMFPMQYDFSLAPLTLQTTQSTSTFSKPSPPKVQEPTDQHGGVGFFTSAPGLPSSATAFQNLMPGINNPGPLGPSPYMSFLPFSPAGGPPTPNRSEPSSANMASTGSMAAANTDIDWPMLDQWMAFTNGELNPFSMSDPGQAPRAQGDMDADWMSTPYSFLGGEPRNRNVEDPHKTATEQHVAGDRRQLGGDLADCVQSNGHTESQYPGY